MLDAWLRINADGSATIFTGKVELGQGISTALVQIAADELDLPLARVEMISGDTAQTPDEAIPPAASRSRTATPRCGASVRRRAPCWSDHAAERLGLSAEALTVSEGVIAAPDGRKLGYGELAAGLRSPP